MAEETRAEAVVENPDGAAEDYDYGYNEECERITVLAHGVSLRRVNVTAEAAPFDLSYRPSRVLLYSPPRQRQKWGDTQVLPRVNWGDLFFDLFYVAATYNVSNIIFDSPNKEGLLYAAGTFLPVMGIWSQKTYYDARYVTEADVFHRLLTIFILVVLGVAVSHIRPVTTLSDAAGESSIFVFTLMLVVERLFALTLYMEVYFRGVGQKQIKSASLRDARLHTFSLPFYVAAMSIAAIEYFGDGISGARRLAEVVEVTTSDYDALHALNETTNIPIFLCLFGYVGSVIIFGFNIIFCFPGGGRHKEIAVPMNIDFMIHRSGEWTMLMLGESIFSILVVDVTKEGVSVFYCSLLTVVFLQILHFQSQPHDADSHALRRSKNSGILWNMFQLVYSLALVVLGATFTFFLAFSDGGGGRRLGGRSLASAYDLEADIVAAANLFGGTLAIIFFCLDSMTLLHLGMEESQDRCVFKGRRNFKGMGLVALRLGLIVFTATLSQWVTKPKDLAIIGMFCVLAQLLLRKFGCTYLTHPQICAVADNAKAKQVVIADDSETGDAQWPNVTHARAEPGEDGQG